MHLESVHLTSSFPASDPSALSDETLLAEASEAASREKKATLALLEYLEEIDRRRLYSARGYATLWEYVHRALGYSESQASERISAMRLMREVPEVKEKLAREELTLTATSKLASFVRRENCSPEQTVELLHRISEKSTREAEKILLSEQTTPVSKPDLLKPTGPESTRISFDADSEFLSLLEELKNLQGHPDWTMNERLKEALRAGIEARKKKHEPKRDAPVLRAPEVKTDSTEPSGSTSPSRRSSRYLSIQVRAAVIARSGHRCEFVDEKTKKRCECRFGLQFDHRIPHAKGGNSSAENIRHLCANHNRFEAVREFGKEKMASYIRS